MDINILSKISEVNSKDWNLINFDEHPFTSYEFLSSLEESKTVCAKTGWQPQHIIIKQNNKVVGAIPIYLKGHSYGEYVFDHSWANAYEKAGGNYYPKLISAIPFTPVNGPRFLYNLKFKNQIIEEISKTIKNLTINNNLSSAHINFLSNDHKEILTSNNWIKRMGLQFHWENNRYQSFNEFLFQLKSHKRKMIKKEREYLQKLDISIVKLTGDDLTSSVWDKFYSFYLDTIDRKWGGAYLNREFFELISEKMSSKILLIISKKDNDIIAGALNFIGNDKLFGRNWGSKINIPFLHFELCYYQAIEFAIQNQLKFVEAGAQGSHKIKRGYLAKPTYSYHFIPNEKFRSAVLNFTKHETKEIQYQISLINKHQNPFSNKIG